MALMSPPYPPTTAVVGGVPTSAVDDPISGVLLALFLISATAHMAVFQVNRLRGHFFIFSAMMFAFSMIRAAALAMRIAWAARPTSVRVAIAANILAQAGTVVVFIINLFLAQRIVRGYHPEFGWSTPARVLFRFFFFSVVACLIMVIVATVQSFYTLDVRTKEADRLVQLFSGTYLALLAFLPIPIVILAATLPRSYRVEKFGEGSWTAKLALLLMTATLLSIGAFFRAGTNFEPRPLRNPAWYHSRATFYIFNFVLDAIVAYTYLASFFHKRFYVPPKAKGPGSYSGEKAKAPGAAASPYITSTSRPGSNFSRSATSFKKLRSFGRNVVELDGGSLFLVTTMEGNARMA